MQNAASHSFLKGDVSLPFSRRYGPDSTECLWSEVFSGSAILDSCGIFPFWCLLSGSKTEALVCPSMQRKVRIDGMRVWLTCGRDRFHGSLFRSRVNYLIPKSSNYAHKFQHNAHLVLLNQSNEVMEEWKYWFSLTETRRAQFLGPCSGVISLTNSN